MSEVTMNANNFIGYEYKDVLATRDREGLYIDSYPNFGWQLDGNTTSLAGLASVCLKFKRNRKIRNKAELSRLQRQFESIVEEIDNLEASKQTHAFIFAMTVGLIGTAFMAGSVFAFLSGLIPLCIVLAIPAFAGWIIPYFGYLKVKTNRSVKVEPIIDQKYDAINEVCEKAHALLS